jgi:hypothetical protein
LNLLSPDLVSPYSQQYNLRVQKDFRGTMVEIGYIGNRTHKLMFPYVSNRAEPIPGIPATTATVDARRPNPEFQSIRTIINSGTFYYDGLKIGIRERMMKGISFDFDYVLSKALSSGDEFYNTLNAEKGVNLSQNSAFFHADLKGPSELDSRHALALSWNYRVPSAKSRSLGWLLTGWRLAGSYRYSTGNWFVVSTSSDAPGFGNVDGESGDRPNILDSTLLKTKVNHPDTSSTVFNPAFFNSDIPPGGRGNMGLRVFRKDDLNITNLSLRREIGLSGESARALRIRVDFYNLLNRPQFERPGDAFPSPTFGKIVDTQNKGRVIQSAFEIVF